MAKGIEIGVGVDASAFEKGVKSGMIEPLEDAQQELTDLGKNKGLDELERDLKAASKATDDLKDETVRDADAIAKAYREQSRAAQQATDETSSHGKEALGEIKQEAIQNASETFSSFDGSAQSLVDGIQGTFGGLVASLGPILGPAGTLAAMVVAGGIGALSTWLGTSGEQSDELKAKIQSLAGELIKTYQDTGRVGITSTQAVVDKINDLLEGGDDTLDSWDEISKAFEKAGLKGEDYAAKIARAMAGNTDDANELLDVLKAQRDELDKVYGVQEAAAAGAPAIYSPQIDAVNELIQSLEAQAGASDVAGQRMAAAAAAGLADLQTKANLIDQVNTAYDDAAGSATDYINEETGLFDTSAYIKAMDERTQALKNYQSALATSGLSDEAKSFLSQQGEDAAAAMVAGYQKASPAQKAELDRIWSEAASSNSGVYVDAANTAFKGLTVVGPDVKLKAPDVGAFMQSVQRQVTLSPIKVTVRAVTPQGVPVW